MLQRFIYAMIFPIYFDSDVYNVYVLLDSCIRAQGNRKEDFCAENYSLHTMVRGQMHAGVKCLQNIINNVTIEKQIMILLHTH